MSISDEELDRELKRKQLEKIQSDIHVAQDVGLDQEKKRREIEKLTLDIKNAGDNLRLEQIKAWAAAFGPAITAVTVLGTVYLGYLQISSKSTADEDANWRQTISVIDGARPENRRHVGTLLKPFLESERYRTTAIGVTIDELPRLRDRSTFNDLFNEAFPSPEPKDLKKFLDLERAMQDEMRRLNSPEGKLIESSKDEWTLIVNESEVLCQPIVNILRNTSHKAIFEKYIPTPKGSGATIPLNDIYFEKCDFTGVDFTDVDLTNSVFDSVRLDDATITDTAPQTVFLWDGIIWWRAKSIGPKLLQFLIQNFKPYQFAPDFGRTEYTNAGVISQSEWDTRVRQLCKNAGIKCADDKLRVTLPSK